MFCGSDTEKLLLQEKNNATLAFQPYQNQPCRVLAIYQSFNRSKLKCQPMLEGTIWQIKKLQINDTLKVTGKI